VRDSEAPATKGDKLKKIVIAAVLVGALALPSVASAKIIRQEGQIVRDNATEVKLRVKVNGGDVRKISGFRAKGIRTNCETGQVRFKYTALDPIDVNDRNRFKVRLTDGEGGFLRIKGKVRRRGRATVGTLKTNRFQANVDGQEQTCKTPEQRFKTSKA